LAQSQNFPASLTANWSFEPSDPSITLAIKRAWKFTRFVRRFPEYRVIVPPRGGNLWAAYFAYLPDDRLRPYQQETLNRLKDTGFKVLCVCATSRKDRIPVEIHHVVDALCWKGFGGYDFSAYAIALQMLADDVPGASAVLLNDSMFGPFSDLRRHVFDARWRLSGFTASSAIENHLQSYAFIVHDVSRAYIDSLKDVFSLRFAYNNAGATILCRETRFARLAHHHMSVGAFFYADASRIGDLCLTKPFDLVEWGFPFMKRSLLSKMQSFQKREDVLKCLSKASYPIKHLSRM